LSGIVGRHIVWNISTLMDDYVIIVYLEVVDLDLDNNCQSPDGYFGDD